MQVPLRGLVGLLPDLIDTTRTPLYISPRETASMEN